MRNIPSSVPTSAATLTPCTAAKLVFHRRVLPSYSKIKQASLNGYFKPTRITATTKPRSSPSPEDSLESELIKDVLRGPPDYDPRRSPGTEPPDQEGRIPSPLPIIERSQYAHYDLSCALGEKTCLTIARHTFLITIEFPRRITSLKPKLKAVVSLECFGFYKAATLPSL